MTREEIAFGLFTLCNAVRILGYIPQMLCTMRDETGGPSTSVMI